MAKKKETKKNEEPTAIVGCNELIDLLYVDKDTHEQIENALIAQGFDSDVYGKYLDAKFKRKTEDDGADFLNDGVAKIDGSDEEEEAEAKLVEEVKLKADTLKLEEEKKAKEKEIEDSEAGKSSLDKSHAVTHVTNDMSKETKKPIARKVVEDSSSGGKIRYTKWHCPLCDYECHQVKHKWECKSPKCLYGKPKPMNEDSIPKEIVRYKLLLEDLKCSVHKVKMVYVGGGRYKVKDGQEEHIAKQVIKVLQNKTWKQLTGKQIEYLASNDESKGFNA